jgi:hypothetical protein
VSVFSDAADVLRRDGWTQHAYEAASGERCVLGALYACDELPGHFTRFRVLCDALGVDHVSGYTAACNAIVAWNDDPATTFEQVLAVLAEADRRVTA